LPPDSINPHWKDFFVPNPVLNLNAKDLINGIRSGDRAILARCITLLESTLPEHESLAQDVLERCLPYTGKGIRLGITGVPGVGKSSFIEVLGQLLIQKGYRVAVLAIDPTSQSTGGSILGDKTRMEMLSRDDRAFIRPSPTGGHLGGVARKTREALLLCEASGYDWIIVETVGVGQSETQVASMTDVFLLLMLAGAGDELQGIKRGIMELADIITITKSDGENKNAAMLAKAEYTSALHLFPHKVSGWTPEVTISSALKNEGIEDVYNIINKYIHLTKENSYLENHRRNQAVYWFRESLMESLRRRFLSHESVMKNIQSIENEVASFRISPYKAALQILKDTV
jgi:LAO/AO transport system kinase